MHYGSEANMPTWPQRNPLASFRQFLVLASPPSIPLSAYVYAVLGVPPTQTGTMMPDLLRFYTRAFNSGCDYGSKAMTVNATVYAAPQALRPDQRSSVWKTRAEKECEADRHGGVVLQSSPGPPVCYKCRSFEISSRVRTALPLCVRNAPPQLRCRVFDGVQSCPETI